MTVYLYIYIIYTYIIDYDSIYMYIPYRSYILYRKKWHHGTFGTWKRCEKTCNSSKIQLEVRDDLFLSRLP
jgi:hypothetical protein